MPLPILARTTGEPGPRLLLVAVWFPPSRASGVFRPLALANHFAGAGWDVTVLTVTREALEVVNDSLDESLLDAVHPAVRVVRVPVPTAHLERDPRRFSRLRGNFPRLHREVYSSLSRFDRYTPWLPNLLARATAEHLRAPFDLALATGNPWTSFAVAAGLHATTGVPYLLDYRDAWTLDQFTGRPAFPAGHQAYSWEPRLLRNAAGVLFVNEPMRDWYAARYPAVAPRMSVLENGFDPRFLGGDLHRPPDPGRPLRFGYLGTLTEQYDNRAFWEGWSLAQGEPELAGATATVHGHFGFFNGSGDQRGTALPARSVPGTVIAGAVPKGQVADVYRDLDALLFLVPGSPYVTSGKTYEYMATGKPILAVHTPDSAAAGPLSGYPLKVTVDPTCPRSVRDGLVRVARLARTAGPAEVAAAVAYARRYERGRLLAPFESQVRRLALRLAA